MKDKSTYLWSWGKLQIGKTQEIHAETNHNQNVEKQKAKEKNLESSLRKMTHYWQETSELNDYVFLIRHHRGQKEQAQHFKSAEGKRNVNLGDKGEMKIFSAESKVTEFIASRSALKELLNQIHQIEGKLHKRKLGTTNYFFPLQRFFKIYLMVESKNTTLSDGIFHVYRCYILTNI